MHIRIIIIYTLLLLWSCGGNNENKVISETETATAFIRAIQNDDFKEAEKYLLRDELNLQLIGRFEQFYHKKDKAELEQLKKSDIIINEIENVSDTMAIVNYSNSYKKEIKNKVKVLRINGKWQIDFKYTISGNLEND